MSFAPSAKSFASSLRHEFQFWGFVLSKQIYKTKTKRTGEKESSDRKRQHQQKSRDEPAEPFTHSSSTCNFSFPLST